MSADGSIHRHENGGSYTDATVLASRKLWGYISQQNRVNQQIKGSELRGVAYNCGKHVRYDRTLRRVTRTFPNRLGCVRATKSTPLYCLFTRTKVLP